MNDLSLLINITLALIAAFFGGVVARRFGLPTIVGYLLTGIAIGPFTPGFVGDVETIQELADLGVVFLMFGVGLHFSFNDLWRVRQIAVPGALVHTAIASLLGFGLTRLWGWSVPSAIVMGLAISVASTVVLLRQLVDHSLLNAPHGRATVGVLVMEDIIAVLILVLMPGLVRSSGGFDWTGLAQTLLKAAAFVAIMFFGGARLIPWLLDRIARTRSRELFILGVLAITLGVALGASELFGISLALGAFVAGAIISESHLSHQVGADVFAFREAFSVLFFVSIGMLVNPTFLWDNLGHVAALSLVVIAGKALVGLLMGLVFRGPARTFLVMALGLSQIGEFSFILGEAGLGLGLLDSDQYGLMLTAALISITANPFMFRLLPRLEHSLRGVPALWKRLESAKALPAVSPDELRGHVVIVGYGRVGSHLVEVLGSLNVPLLVIETDLERLQRLGAAQIATLFGDPANSEIVTHANLEGARALVITVPSETTAAVIVASARQLNPRLPIIVRAATREGVAHLLALGADHVVHPELEGGLEMVHHTLLQLGFPLQEVHQYTESVRRDRYDVKIDSAAEHRTLHDLLFAAKGIEVSWVQIGEDSPVVGRTLQEADLRSRTGASVVALLRQSQLTANPKSHTLFEAGDRIGLIGDETQIEAARNWLSAGESPVDVTSS